MSWRPEGERRRFRWGPLIVVLIVAAAVGGGLWLYLSFDDPQVLSRSIENRTAETLYLFLRDEEGEEDRFDPAPRVPPNASIVVYGCGAGEWVARTLDGTLVARRGPFEECNSEDWVIEGSR